MKVLILLMLLLPGCMTGSHKEVRSDGSMVHVWFVSIAGQRKVDQLTYGPLKIQGASSDETKAIESAIQGAIKGIKP